VAKAIVTLLLAFAAFAFESGAGAASRSTPAIAVVLAKIRTATGAAAMTRLATGLAIEEQSGDSSRRSWIGSRRGMMLIENELGYDGDLRWRPEPRRGGFVPLNRRQFEKLAIPLWIRGSWWLDPKSGFTARVSPAESDPRMLALNLASREGLVKATLYVDRATWLPARLVLPYDRGPFTAVYSDYRRVAGVNFPFRTEESYRGAPRVWTAAIRVMGPGEAHFAPAPLGDARFDPAVPAEVKWTRGSPFGGGATPHIYVEPEVEGKPIGWFLFDSGADGMMIDEKLADALAMPVVGRATSVGADGNPRPASLRKGRSFRIGRLTFPAPLYLALDLSKNNSPPLQSRAGVIGYDVFARAVVEFTGAGDRTTICDPKTYRLPPGAAWQKLEFIDSTPAVRARFEGGREGLFQIDTGSASSVGFYPAFVERQSLLKGRETRETQSQGAGGSFTTRVGRIGWFELGGRRFPNLEVEYRASGISRDGGAGVIGRELLAHFTTIFDYPGRRIAFLPLGPEPGASGCPAPHRSPDP
jgi:hypothetical protein